MKSIKLITIIICSLSLCSLALNQIKKAKPNNFLNVDENIENEDLRFELEQLKKEFNGEKQKIKDSYENRIIVLKEKRKEENCQKRVEEKIAEESHGIG